MNRVMIPFAGLAIFLLLFAPSLFAVGAGGDQGEDIFDLGEVTVTASRLSTIEAGETVHEIRADDIKKTNARTLDEALVLLSDVNIKVGGEGVPRVEIRGFKSRDILVLLDGVPVNSAFDGQFDPSTIPVDSIAKIKVISGASSVLYGQGGLGGVIDITTKKGQQRLTGTVGYEGGDGTPYRARASLSGSKGKYDFFLSGSAYHRDHIPLAKSFTSSVYEEAGYRKNSDNTSNNVSLNLGFTPNDDLHLALTGNYAQGGYGKPASAINTRFDPYAPQPIFGRVDDYERYLFQLVADYNRLDAFYVRSRVYYNRIDQDNNQYDDENYDSYDNPLVPNSYRFRNIAINKGASVQPGYDFGRAGEVTLNLSGEWDTWRDSGVGKLGNGANGAQGGHGLGSGSPPYLLYPIYDHYDLSIYSAAIEYKASLLKNLGFAAGIANHWQLREDRDLVDYSISASLYYDILRETRLKAAFMRNIRFPTLSQLYLLPNAYAGLTYETVYHYQLGVEQKLPRRSVLKVNGFYSNHYDFIALNQFPTSQAGLFVPRYINVPHMRYYGFETSLETSFVKRLQLRLAYTLNVSRNLSGPAFADNNDQLQYVPEHKFVFNGSYNFDFGLTPFLSVIYVADSAVYSKQQYVTVLKAHMADYVVANLKLSQRLFKDRLTVYAGADNILNTNYEDTYGVPRAGRFVYGGFEYRF